MVKAITKRLWSLVTPLLDIAAEVVPAVAKLLTELVSLLVAVAAEPVNTVVELLRKFLAPVLRVRPELVVSINESLFWFTKNVMRWLPQLVATARRKKFSTALKQLGRQVVPFLTGSVAERIRRSVVRKLQKLGQDVTALDWSLPEPNPQVSGHLCGRERSPSAFPQSLV